MVDARPAGRSRLRAPYIGAAVVVLGLSGSPAFLARWRPDGRVPAVAVALVESTEFASYADIRRSGIHHFGEPPDEDGAMRISATGTLDF